MPFTVSVVRSCTIDLYRRHSVIWDLVFEIIYGSSRAMIWVNENIKSGYNVLSCQEISLIFVYKTTKIPFCLWCTAGLSHKKTDQIVQMVITACELLFPLVFLFDFVSGCLK